MKRSCFLVILAALFHFLFGPTARADGLSVQYKCAGTNPNENQIRAHFRIRNHTGLSVPLAELSIRYWYGLGDDKAQKYWCDWAKIGAANVTASFHKIRKPVRGADGYVEIGFTGGAGAIEAGSDSGEIQIRLAKDDWSNFDQSGDYSYDAAKTDFAETPRVTLYRNGKLIWGAEPGDDAAGLAAGPAGETPAKSSRIPWPPQGGVPTSKNEYLNRFFTLWGQLHDPAKGYFSPEGVPYHSVETLIIEAPDQGHETTSEAMSYWLWLEAAYGRATGDWKPLAAAWNILEEYAIPTHGDQPTNGAYNASRPATYAAEHDTPAGYPSSMDQSTPVGQDPLAAELRAAYGTADVYGMHWLLDVDNWYGYGRRGDGTGRPTFINTFQRGPKESVWKTVPHPSWDAFRFGGRNGFLDLFTRDANYARQWRYTNAPDADARAIQAMYWAHTWAEEQGKTGEVPTAKAARMGDYLRYAFFDKYFKRLGCRSPREPGASSYESAHYLLSWYYGWGGAADTSAAWAWRIGCSHVHFGYQNPMAAWVLSAKPAFKPLSQHGVRDWDASLKRQLEFYRWLQSAEGGIAGGATNSWKGRYEPPPADAPTFYGMAYDWQPVYHDPPSNDWFGMQAWSMERVAEYYCETGDERAKTLLDKWVAWAIAQTELTTSGGFAVPAKLEWKGQPDTWNPANPGRNTELHVAVLERNQDIGVAAALAKTLIFYSAGTKRWAKQDAVSLAMAREILDRMWNTCRDERGLSAPEPREDYKAIFEQEIPIPAGWSGRMANGDVIRNGVKFLDIRSKYKTDPDFAKVEEAHRSGKAPVFRYHRFWAECEAATAYALAAIIGGLDR